jgi:hypothetical protein
MQYFKREAIKKRLKIWRPYNQKTLFMELYILYNCIVKEKLNRLYRNVILYFYKIQSAWWVDGCFLDSWWLIKEIWKRIIHI